MYDGNSLAISWSDIRHYGFKDWEDYEQYLAELEEEDDGKEEKINAEGSLCKKANYRRGKKKHK